MVPLGFRWFEQQLLGLHGQCGFLTATQTSDHNYFEITSRHLASGVGQVFGSNICGSLVYLFCRRSQK